MRLKPGVRINGVRPELLFALNAAQGVYADREMVVTSIIDGKHSRGSLHYTGCAADLRTRDLEPKEAILIRDTLAEHLGEDFDVVLEKTHIHLEYQPKRPY